MKGGNISSMWIKKCRVCGGGDLSVLIDFGEVALADGFLNSAEEIAAETKEPLRFCICTACKHLQIDYVVDREKLFKHYLYTTGVSETMVAHGSALVDAVASVMDTPTSKPRRVLELASNDGSILKRFQEMGAYVLGVDPAENLVDVANAAGIPSIAEFFDVESATRISRQYEPFDVVIARNVLAHVADLGGFVQGMGLVLAQNGVAIVEVPHALTMFEQLQYDQIFHEHIGYFTLQSLEILFERYGLQVFSARQIPLHGGSLQVFIAKREAGRARGAELDRIGGAEIALGLTSESAWRNDFAARVHAQAQALRNELVEQKRAGKRLAAYGASGKGQAMLQFCGIDRSLLDYIVDRSELKQGKLSPGTHIPVVGPERLRDDRPDVLLLNAWALADEIQRQQRTFVEAGGRFLHPIPMPHYL